MDEGLRSLSFRRIYRPGKHLEDPVKELLIPCLNNSIEFNLVTGYFTSGFFQKLFFGLRPFLNRGGTIKLLTGWLYEKEIEIILKDENELRTFLYGKFEQIISDFSEMENKNQLEILAWLLLNEKLIIRVGLPIDEKGRPLILLNDAILHKKIGFFKDEYENLVSFSGSANATVAAWYFNLEDLKVFNNWEEKIRPYCEGDVNDFYESWNNKDESMYVCEVSDLPQNILDKLSQYRRDFKELIFPDEGNTRNILGSNTIRVKSGSPWLYYENSVKKIINTLQLRQCQQDAIEYLESNEPPFCGILSMATGSGKTITAIKAIYKLNQTKRNLLTIVAVPDKYLVSQWMKALKNFLHEKEIIQISSDFPNSKKQSLFFTRLIALKDKKVAILVGTNRSLNYHFFKALLKEKIQPDNILLISDECHALGAPVTSFNFMDFNPTQKIGLSATFVREFDDEGTNFIMNYFCNKDPFQYTLEEGQADGILMDYMYQYFIVSLSNEDLTQYCNYSRRIGWNLDDTLEGRNSADQNLIARARILKKNPNKLAVCGEIIQHLHTDNKLKKLVIYCFDKDSGPSSQINLLLNQVIRPFIRKNDQYSYMIFDGSLNREDRLKAIEDFSKDDSIIFIAMKCLDQGVDIPSLERAIFLASSGTEREHIQRAGRLLRKNEEKLSSCECVEIYDVLTFPTQEQYNLHSSTCESILEYETKRAKFFLRYSTNSNDISKLEDKIFDIQSSRIKL